MGQYDIDLLPVVGAGRATGRAGLRKAFRIRGQTIQPTTLPMKTTAGAGERQRERDIADRIGDLEFEFAQSNADGVLAQHSTIDGQGGRNRMAEVLPSHRAQGPCLEILLDLLADEAPGDGPQLGGGIAAQRKRHASAGAALEREQAVGRIGGRELAARALHGGRFAPRQTSLSSSLLAARRRRATPRLRIMAMASPTSSQERGWFV